MKQDEELIYAFKSYIDRKLKEQTEARLGRKLMPNEVSECWNASDKLCETISQTKINEVADKITQRLKALNEVPALDDLR